MMAKIDFHVQDSKGNPIPDATIGWAQHATTDAEGNHEAQIAPGQYGGTVSAPGYDSRTFDWGFGDDGSVVIGLEAGSGPVPPPVTGDAIDLSQAVITNQSPDVRGWPIGAHLSSLSFSETDNMGVEFSKRNGDGSWPFVMGPEGEIQYTLWVGCRIKGVWQLCGSILCISRAPDDNYVPTGPALMPGQLPKNWYYFAGLPLAEYQPQPGEQVAWFVTAGVQRRTDIHDVAERTQVVLAPFSPGTFTFK